MTKLDAVFWLCALIVAIHALEVVLIFQLIQVMGRVAQGGS